MKQEKDIRIHPTAEVSPAAHIGSHTSIWHQSQVREDVQIGENCTFGKGVYVDFGVKIGNDVKVQNYVSIYHGVKIEDGVLIGPHVCFTNDNIPRAINPDGSPKTSADWTMAKTLVKYGASLGANSTILPKVTVGKWAMVGAGSVVTRDVPDYGLVVGSPARLIGFVCSCGKRLVAGRRSNGMMLAVCPKCHKGISIPLDVWKAD